MKRIIFLVSFFFAVILTVPAVAQCPMCKANVQSTMREDTTKKTGLGLNDGIILLLSMPYVAAVVVGVLWYRNSRFKKQKRLVKDN